MDDSGAILCQISSLKEMLDQVNEEIEADIQITREIESEIVRYTEIENILAARESELMKMAYTLEFEINGLNMLTADSRTSVKQLEKELSCLRIKRDEILSGMNKKREVFISISQGFQKDTNKRENDELMSLLSEKELVENEIHSLMKKNDALENSMSAFLEENLEELHNFNSGLKKDGNQDIRGKISRRTTKHAIELGCLYVIFLTLFSTAITMFFHLC